MDADELRTKRERAEEGRERLRREFVVATPVALAGVLGALPLGATSSAGTGPDPIVLLVWLALWAPAAGWACGAAGLRLVPTGLAVPGLWMIVLALVDASSPVDLPAPLQAGLVWTGLFAAFWGLGTLAPARALRGAGALLLVAALLVGLPGRGGLGGAPWPPRAASVLLDLSPATLLVESAGRRDWMWHRSVYAQAGTDRLRREPYRGSLAGPTALLVGCLVAAAAWLRRRALASDGK